MCSKRLSRKVKRIAVRPTAIIFLLHLQFYLFFNSIAIPLLAVLDEVGNSFANHQSGGVGVGPSQVGND